MFFGKQCSNGFAVRPALLFALVSMMWISFFLNTSPAQAAAPMAFRMVTLLAVGCNGQCPQIMAAEGEIDEEAAYRFASFLKSALDQHKDHPATLKRLLYLSSVGGNVFAATQLGTLFRRAGITVVIAEVHDLSGHAFALEGRCLSACIYAMMGGQKRIVPEKALLGVHCMFSKNFVHDPSNQIEQRYEFATPQMVAILRRYSQKMGINPQLIALAQKIGPNDMYYLTPQEMTRWQLGEPSAGLMLPLR